MRDLALRVGFLAGGSIRRGGEAGSPCNDINDSIKLSSALEQIPSTVASSHPSDSVLYVALATIALGNGLFLPSLPSQINDLYEPHDPRLGRAYNIYYVGINLGGFLAPLVCGTLGEFYGWHWGFAAAGIGMFLGLIVYIAGGKYPSSNGLPPSRQHGERRFCC